MEVSPTSTIFQNEQFNFCQQDTLIDIDLISSSSKLFEKHTDYEETLEEKVKRVLYGIANISIILSSTVLLVLPIFPLNVIGAGIAMTYISAKFIFDLYN
jgi:hypothetical protein